MQKNIRILQINLNKSEKAHLDLLNNTRNERWDLVLIQEPHVMSKFLHIRTPANYRQIFPENRGRDDSMVRSIIWVSKSLETRHWANVDIPGSNDITAIRLMGEYGQITIFNIYNDCTHANNERDLKNFLRAHTGDFVEDGNHHMIWAGDFNRHHPMWDRDEDDHLFTPRAQRAAEKLIDLLSEHNMIMLLPKDTPTLKHMYTKKFSRPDNVFGSPGIQDHVIRCEVIPSLMPTGTDHYPIVTNLTLPQNRASDAPNFNFRDVDWDDFRKKLEPRLTALPDATVINTQEQLNAAATGITLALKTTIQECVKRSKPRPDSKRWWNSDLRKQKKLLNKLRAESFRDRALTHLPIHRTLRTQSNKYGESILLTKRQHWANYLEEMSADNIWLANKYIKEPVGDGGSPRIPTLRAADEEGTVREVNNSEDKARLLAKTFFPPPPTYLLCPPRLQLPRTTPRSSSNHIA